MSSTCVGSATWDAVRLAEEARTVVALAGAASATGAGAGNSGLTGGETGSDCAVTVAAGAGVAVTRSAAVTPPEAVLRTALPEVSAPARAACRAGPALPPRAVDSDAFEVSAALAPSPRPASSVLADATAHPSAEPAPTTTPATATPRQSSLTVFTVACSDLAGKGVNRVLTLNTPVVPGEHNGGRIYDVWDL